MTKLDRMFSTLTTIAVMSEVCAKQEREKYPSYKSPNLKERNPKEWHKKQLQKQARKKNRGKR